MIQIDLSGKTAVVTGGGQGLGLATATVLHTAGANVAINYFEDPEGKNRAIAETAAQSPGDRSIAVEGDVRDRNSISTMLASVADRFGSIDFVINNAAILSDRSFRKMEDSDWAKVIETNLTGVFNVCKEAADLMSDGGRIVNMSSISGFVGFFGQANYASAKAGVVALTKVLSKELARRNITVNAVAPGVVMTDMGKTIPEETQTEMLKQIPLNRFGQPEDIANTILYLCSPLSNYVTGQTIHVNGGWYG